MRTYPRAPGLSSEHLSENLGDASRGFGTQGAPRDRDGQFSENYSSATCAAERHWYRPWRRCTYRACPTLKVKAITEELCGHGFSASTVSNINQRLDESLAQFAQHPWWTHVIAPTLAHLGRPDCRYAAPRSQPSAGCCTRDRPRGTCRRRRPESHASSRHSAPGRSRGPGCHRLGTGGTLVRRRRGWDRRPARYSAPGVPKSPGDLAPLDTPSSTPAAGADRLSVRRAGVSRGDKVATADIGSGNAHGASVSVGDYPTVSR